jgi:hypothetical protein
MKHPEEYDELQQHQHGQRAQAEQPIYKADFDGQSQ